MKKTTILLAWLAALVLAACSTAQKQAVTELPETQIDVEALIDGIDYDMDISTLSIADVYVLRHAPAALRGYPFRDALLRGVYGSTTWYDSLMWDFDANIAYDGEQREDETYRDYYYRMADETDALDYDDEEEAFMERLKEREKELMKLNFDVEDPVRVNMQNLMNPTQLEEMDPVLAERLATNGFAIVPANHEQMFHVYEQNDYSCFPSFVTTDLYLQLFHLYIDCMLREVEEQTLLPLITDFSRSMYNVMHAQAVSGDNADIRQLAHHNAVFFAVAYQLLTDNAIGTADEQAEAQPEVDKVMKSENSYSDFMADFRNTEFAYSLFRPRGHYTRNEQLQRYFRGMMWLQSVPFGMEHDEEVREAVLLAGTMMGLKEETAKYETIDQLVTFLMGKPDNIAIPQVQTEMTKMGVSMEQLLADNNELQRLKEALEEVGEKQTRIRPKYERSSHNKICLMPQRYQPDAEVLQEMVDYDSTPSLRPVPKGLDVFAAMGVASAEQILNDEGQQWQDFKPIMKKMKTRMQEIDWKETVVTQWMEALRTIADEPAADAPYFMGTPEWDVKNLNAMLASWAELKHDAILYAKQPMGAECGGDAMPAPVVKGYVEPNVAFWKKAIQLLDNTHTLLQNQGMLTEKIGYATTRIREQLQFLLNVSEKELKGKALSEVEYDQIKAMGAIFENISLDLIRQENQYLMGWGDVEGADRKLALVADVYTANADNNPEKCILFEGVGAADEIFVVVEIAGYLYLARGAVFSYREFRQPVHVQRLTDEEWQQQLESNPRKGVPEWMDRIIVPLDDVPTPNEEYFYSSGC